METKKVVIRDIDQFESSVFGADHFIRFFPNLVSGGVYCRKVDNRWYILKGNEIVHDTCFFTEEEMQYLKEIDGE